VGESQESWDKRTNTGIYTQERMIAKFADMIDNLAGRDEDVNPGVVPGI
jgi:hypothetical protein